MNCTTGILEATQSLGCVASESAVEWILRYLGGPMAIMVSAFVATMVARSTIRANRATTRKLATLNLIERSESTEYYQERYIAFRDARQDPNGMTALFDPTNSALKSQRRLVLEMLNHYELIASGIKSEILDEGFYKNYMRSTFVRDWKSAAPLVAHIRRPTPDSGADVPATLAFSEFEALAVKWEAEMRKAGLLSKATKPGQ